MGFRDWLFSRDDGDESTSRSSGRTPATNNTNHSHRTTPSSSSSDGEFPWLHYPNRGWKVPCPACEKNVTNELSAFRSHWQHNSDCPGPEVVDDGTWAELGVAPSELPATHSTPLSEKSSDSEGTTSSSEAEAATDARTIQEEYGFDGTFPFIGESRERMVVQCPGCNQSVDNTRRSLISHWVESENCEGPPSSRPSGVEMSRTGWEELVERVTGAEESAATETGGTTEQSSPTEMAAEADQTPRAASDRSSNTQNASDVSPAVTPGASSEEDTSGDGSELGQSQSSQIPAEARETTGNTKDSAVGSSYPEDIPPEIHSPSVDQAFAYDDLELDEPVGRGGNADVYRATLSTGVELVTLAVKEPRMSGTIKVEAVQQLLDEAETWKQLDDHDHIISVIGYGSEPLPWIAMEYMDAGNLADRADGLDFDQALWTAIAITKAVRHAHRRGIAHLDLKPENVLFQSVEGAWDVPKVGDWGLSRHLFEHSKSVEGISPQYAAPEQFDESFGAVDDVTDVYQLGAVCYKLFTGQPPFVGRPMKVMRSVLDVAPQPPSEVADVPPELDEILLTALAKEKADRYESIIYLRDELQALW